MNVNDEYIKKLVTLSMVGGAVASSAGAVRNVREEFRDAEFKQDAIEFLSAVDRFMSAINKKISEE